MILFSVVVVDLIGFGVVVPILPFIAEHYGASATVLGLLLTSFSAMQFVFSPIWGRLSDRIGRRPVLLFTIAGSVLSLVFLAYSTSIPFLFIARMCAGLFAANISVASAYVTDVTSEEDRTKGMGLIGAAFGVGFLLGPALGGFLSQNGFRLPLLVAAGLNFLNLIHTAIRLPEPARHHRRDDPIQTSALKHKGVFSVCGLNLLFTISINQLEAVFALFMMERFFFNSMKVAMLLSFMALLMIIIQGGLIRPLGRRYGEKILFVVGTLFLAVAFVLIPYSPTALILLIPLTFAAVGRALGQPTLMSLASKMGPPHGRGAVMGTFQASASLGRVFGPLIAGLLYDRKITAPFYFAAGLMLFVTFLSEKLKGASASL